jgi:hypothetical protein
MLLLAGVGFSTPVWVTTVLIMVTGGCGIAFRSKYRTQRMGNREDEHATSRH